MKFKGALAVIGLGVLAAASLPAHATFQLTNTNGTFSVDEFDWASNGVAWTNGFAPVAGSSFTLNYADYAVAVNNLGSTVIDSSQGLDNTANGVDNGYEYTIFATLTETVNSCVLNPDLSTTCSFHVTGGTFDIFYDTAANANNTTTAWTGFQDGIDIINGNINSSIGGSFTLVFPGTTGAGGATLFGTTTGQNFTYVNPTLGDTTASTTLQLGAAAGGFVPPTSVDGIVLPIGQPVFKGDANQQFLNAPTVPEPASLALLGLGLAVLTLVTRRREQK